MLSRTSGKNYRQNRASSKSWCCRHDHNPSSANTFHLNTIEDFCPCLAHFYHTSPQNLAIEGLVNHQWQKDGIRNKQYLFDLPLPNDLSFTVYPSYSDGRDGHDCMGYARDTGPDFRRARSENFASENPRSNTSPLHARNSSTSQRVQQIVENISFRAAAEKLYSVLSRADVFLHAFLQSFQKEMTRAVPYLDRTSAWKEKVAYYNRHLVLPTIEEGQKEAQEQQDQNEDHAAAICQPDKADFAEYEQQMTEGIEVLCHDKLELCSPDDSEYLKNNSAREDSVVNLELPDAQCADIELRHQLAQGLVMNVRNTKPALLRNVAKMSADYRAASEVLADVKKLKDIFDEYKRCWNPETRNPSDR